MIRVNTMQNLSKRIDKVLYYFLNINVLYLRLRQKYQHKSSDDLPE